MLLWIVFLGFCALGSAGIDVAVATVPRLGPVTYYWLTLLATVALGLGTLSSVAGGSERTVARTMCRILAAYLLFELLVVIPVAVWLGTVTLAQTLGSMAVRATWLLFPVMLAVCSDERARRLAGIATVAAAALLVTWGVYAAATGGGGFYADFYGGPLRYRILGASAPVLIGWPFILAVSGAVPRSYSAALLVLSGVGVALSNQRSELIALAVAGSICIAMSGQIRRVVPAMVPVALAATIVALVWGPQLNRMFGFTLSHMFEVSSGNGADRIMRWRLAWDYFRSRPFNDWVWSWRYYLVYLERDYRPHNFVMEIATSEGLAGLAFYVSMLWIALRDAWSWGRRDAEARALIGWLVMYVVYSLANANHYLPTNMPLLVAALAALAARVDWLRRFGGQGRDSHLVSGVRV